jgi:hypothetical protein
VRHQDGSRRWDRIERDLRRDGYVQQFRCMYGEAVPDDFQYTGRETGWELRRKIRDWCRTNGMPDHVILRNTSYHRDLHGAVYEAWTRTAPPAAGDLS